MAISGKGARYRLLYELGCAFAARLELAELVPMVVAETRRVLDATGVSVLLHDAAHNELYFPYVALTRRSHPSNPMTRRRHGGGHSGKSTISRSSGSTRRRTGPPGIGSSGTGRP